MKTLLLAILILLPVNYVYGECRAYYWERNETGEAPASCPNDDLYFYAWHRYKGMWCDYNNFDTERRFKGWGRCINNVRCYPFLGTPITYRTSAGNGRLEVVVTDKDYNSNGSCQVTETRYEFIENACSRSTTQLCPPSGGGYECDELCFSYSPSINENRPNSELRSVDPCCIQSPILIDVLGNGFDLTDAQNGVDFDFNGDGIRHRTSWTSTNSDDAWLALDRNNNGMIDNARELFGNFTEQPAPLPDEEKHGFRALAVYDNSLTGKKQQGDGVIDDRDAIFRQLRLWQDVNHNGISEQNELRTLPELGIAGIELDYKESKRTDEFGNQFKYRAKVWDEGGAQAGRWAWDVFLVAK
ncbi:MAG TPA: hypothetical protein VF648_07920 [Pyrinomonadaceae bacterium]|jgi:hypothetical protein